MILEIIGIKYLNVQLEFKIIPTYSFFPKRYLKRDKYL